MSKITRPPPSISGTICVMPNANTWFTFQSPDVWLGEFRLPPGDAHWGRTNQISDIAPLIAFPGTTVGITQEGRREVVADPTRAVLYRAGQPYRRRLVSGEGDRCTFVTFGNRLAAEAALDFDGAAADPVTYRFPFAIAPLERTHYALVQRLRHAVTAGADRDGIREGLYWLVGKVVAAGYVADGRHQRTVLRPITARVHRDTVESLREELGVVFAGQATLDELAARVHMSPFHLARVFRDATGTTIHAYRTELRLRASLRQIADGESLAEVAAATGFASQAHLTDRFRRAFGTTPNAWRMGPAEIRTIVKANGVLGRLA